MIEVLNDLTFLRRKCCKKCLWKWLFTFKSIISDNHNVLQTNTTANAIWRCLFSRNRINKVLLKKILNNFTSFEPLTNRFNIEVDLSTADSSYLVNWHLRKVIDANHVIKKASFKKNSIKKAIKSKSFGKTILKKVHGTF